MIQLFPMQCSKSKPKSQYYDIESRYLRITIHIRDCISWGEKHIVPALMLSHQTCLAVINKVCLLSSLWLI